MESHVHLWRQNIFFINFFFFTLHAQDKYSNTHHKLTWQQNYIPKHRKTMKIYYTNFTFHFCATSHNMSVLPAREKI